MIGNLKKSAISIVKREKKCEVKRKVPIDIDLIWLKRVIASRESF